MLVHMSVLTPQAAVPAPQRSSLVPRFSGDWTCRLFLIILLDNEAASAILGSLSRFPPPVCTQLLEL